MPHTDTSLHHCLTQAPLCCWLFLFVTNQTQKPNDIDTKWATPIKRHLKGSIEQIAIINRLAPPSHLLSSVHECACVSCHRSAPLKSIDAKETFCNLSLFLSGVGLIPHEASCSCWNYNSMKSNNWTEKTSSFDHRENAKSWQTTHFVSIFLTGRCRLYSIMLWAWWMLRNVTHATHTTICVIE